MELPHDPYQIFRNNASPLALYARGYWLREQNLPEFQEERQSRIQALHAGQAIDGSWEGSVIETGKHLFGLHLTQREKSPEVVKALKWLFECDLSTETTHEAKFQRLPKRDAIFLKKRGKEVPRDLPFLATDLQAFKKAVALFHATVFEWTAVKKVRMILEYHAFEARRYGDWGTPAKTSNMLRVYLVNPLFTLADFVQNLIRYLAKKQTAAGDWGNDYNFYQVFNSLAHSDDPVAYKQVTRAFDYLVAHQHTDGTWGKKREEKELATFLVVHGLRRVGLLT